MPTTVKQLEERLKKLESAKEESNQQVLSPVVSDLKLNNNFVTIKHSCNPGDIVASMIVCKKYYELTRRKVFYCQRVDFPGQYYPGAVHPTLDKHGIQVTLNESMFNMMKPLVESQEYIERFEPYNGQRIVLDFDDIRNKINVNLPQGSIQSWLMYAFHDLWADISKPWITLPNKYNQISEVVKGKVLINFTERYRDALLEYYFLKSFEPDLIFVGTPKEHYLFCDRFQLVMPLLEVHDFLELAVAIKSARFLMCNQSFNWNLATALGTPRIVEICKGAQNCLPFYGDWNYGYMFQSAAEWAFRHFFNELK